MVIPTHILANAKGLVVLTVLKAGFLFSGRAGSGVIVARLPDGSWSGPSAVVTAGAGVGGQIGAELTDFVFILNTKAAVDTFAQAGSITLGGNVSLAAGPLGRNAEAAGSASLKSVAAVFSYSKTKGLFAGISLEGSVLVERREANRKFYGNNCTAKSILGGRVDPPPECDPLFRVLESRAFRGVRPSDFEDDYYDDIPDYNSDSSSVSGGGNYSSSPRRGSRRAAYDDDYDDDGDVYGDRRRGGSGGGNGSRRGGGGGSSSSWQDDLYDRPASSGTRSGQRRYDDDDGDLYDRSNNRNRDHDRDRGVDDVTRRMGRANFRSTYSDKPPGRPAAPKPSNRDYDYDNDDDDAYYSRKRNDRTQHRQASPAKPARVPPSSSGGEEAVARYTFDGEQDGDLSFQKGDIITIVKRSDSTDDWWTGKTATGQGIFPANYVDLL
ncbi:Ysc84p [Sugiyamaella lignohabitans]|uniref:Ysc84p n=1 Tax=Sugiyamaella lignohabitans TaxID=796027 RepID=A0A167F3C0_9ASCO|nr:Ysc84p [Sugiyamaella lignohabitans]ANB14774.1 Ysc84p [Sugiyamaella lignohabitans]